MMFTLSNGQAYIHVLMVKLVATKLLHGIM